MVHGLRSVVIDEPVGQGQRADDEPVIEPAGAGKQVEDMAAEAADRPFLNGEKRLMLAGQTQYEIAVQRFGETGIGDCRRQAVTFQDVGRFERLLQPSAQRDNGDRVAFAHDAATADFQNLAALR